MSQTSEARIRSGAVWAVCLGVGLVAWARASEPPPDDGGPRAGPDLIIGDLTGPSNYGQDTEAQKCAYALGRITCNIGNVPANWIDGTPNHPAHAAAMYRFKSVNGAGRFEQIGQAWVRWEFCCLQSGHCSPPNCQPVCGGCCSQLGTGCSDTTTSARSGTQSLLGPKSIINVSTGFVPATHPTPGTGRLPGRVQVRVADLDPAQNQGAVYYGEHHVIAADDAAAGNKMNNAGYRRFSGVGAAPSYNLSFIGTQTVRMQPAIMAWANHDAGVQFVNLDTNPVSDGRFVLGAKATALGGNAWHYEYAIYNLNSDRAGQAFSVPIADAVGVSNIGFRDVDYWAEPYSDADWTPTLADGALTWAAETYAQNVNANALRWGTLYNFRFDADAPPTNGTVTLTIFKPGTPAAVTATVPVPCGPPIFDPIADAATVCGRPYAAPPPAVRGSGPFVWQLAGSPPAGMTIDPDTGALSWPDPVAADAPYPITIRAESVCGPGSDEATFLLTAARGDFTGDGRVTAADSDPFVEHLLGKLLDALCAADVNGDGAVDGRDIASFIERREDWNGG